MKKRINLAALSSLLISCSSLCYSDDAEIFFNDKLTPEKPNVIFLLDTSGSMASGLQGSTRLAVLKSSLLKLLDDKDTTTDIRAGMFSFASGTRLLEQVNDIDTNREQLKQRVNSLTAGGSTFTVQALYDVAQYISPNSYSGALGPYHNSYFGQSPILEGCQLSHIILMTDGRPEGSNFGNYVAAYIGAPYSSASYCQVVTGKNSDGSPITVYDNSLGIASYYRQYETCGRALTSWMSRTDQAPKIEGDNYIRTHTIAFTINEPAPLSFLEDLAKYGGGKSYLANSDATLLAAFKEIISDVRAADSPSASGTVTIGEQARYEQRTEVFYSLYSSADRNYWPGNMKRFKIEYVDTPLVNSTKIGQRAVLVDKNGASAMSPEGTFYTNVSSFWSSGDGGKVSAGGVLGQLKAPAERNMFTLQNKTDTVSLKSGAFLDLGVDIETKNGLLDFIRGYTFRLGGSTEPEKDKKIGDAARGRIALASYGCSNGIKTDIVNCDTNSLQQTALLASNDGFIRGYDIQTGEALFEYMPEEMLPLIQKLQRQEAVSFRKSRYYGLDGKPVIYHQDTNNDYYINNSEKAYAYIAAGRGGSSIYALNISSPKKPVIEWQITGGQGGTNGFEDLGYTWSTPTLGNIKINGKVKPVLVFGGGYDLTPQESQISDGIDRDTVAKRTTNKGNSIYIVDAESGSLIWSASDPKMVYGIPSTVALVTDNSNDKLITNIFVGDMGGQVWRFMIDNNKTNLSISGGVIAELAGNSNSQKDARKFYQAPSVYESKISGTPMLTVTIGSGFRNHPLNIDIEDRIYSLRVPKNATNQNIISESDLATTATDGQSVNGNLSNGFMIKLSGEGEKVISDGYAGFDRFVFNTFIPSITGKKTCVPSVGTLRTYNYDLVTGKSLLKDPYRSIGITALPPDVTTYCDGKYCTIISDPSLLSKDQPLPLGKDKDAFIVDTTPTDRYAKIGWTDLFDISK